MRWPSDHPAVTDPALAPHAAGADEVAPGASAGAVLRHLPGRRVATAVHLADGRHAVLKVFASPRGRGNDRRLSALAATAVAGSVPTSLGVDRAGHVSLISWAPGQVYDEVDDDTFVAVAGDIGRSLAALHRSGAAIDRSWTVDDELVQLLRRATPRSRPLADAVVSDPMVDRARLEPLRTAHRDCHPRQVVVDGLHPRWIDLDDCAMAPPGLDVGNFLAHLRRDAAIGRRDTAATRAAIRAFVEGYGELPSTTAWWETASLARLVGLAESRHGQVDWALAIARLVDTASVRA